MPRLLHKIRDGTTAISRRTKASLTVWMHVIKVAKPFFTAKKTRWIAAAYVAGIVATLLISAEVNVYFSKMLGYFINEISGEPNSDVDGILRWMVELVRSTGLVGVYGWPVVFLIVLLLLDPVQCLGNYLQVRLGIVWRWFLDQDYFGGYFAKLAWYRLEFNKGVDNPDQRMTDNVRDFCATSVVLFVSLITAATNIVAWTPNLWRISVELTVGVYGWAIFASLVSAFIGRPMVRLNNKLNACESDLRFALQEARREAQAIAFFGAEEVARSHASARLQAVVAMQKAIIRRNFFVQLFTTVAGGIVGWMAPVIIAPFVLKTHDVGLIFQAQTGVGFLYGALAIVINQFQLISAYLAMAERLGSLQDAMKECSSEAATTGGIIFEDGQEFVFANVTIASMDGKSPLVDQPPLSLVLSKGEKLCVLGNDALAKSELVRMLSRLTVGGSGRLRLPPREQIMFLTETPYLPPMTLRQAVTYPCETCSDDESILTALRLVGLDDLVHRCGGLDTVQAWRTLLKLDELQRLSFARVVFKDHRYIIIDEALSALDEATQKHLYAILMRPGTSIISVVKKTHLLPFHNKVLVFPGDGKRTWHCCKVSEYEANRDGGDEPPINRG